MSDNGTVSSNGFGRRILEWYRTHGRHDLPWRKSRNPYNILVSEVMLQQTQISRVIEKYREFLLAFPSVRALARANARDVLVVWQGLGYNRRALYLQRAAYQIVKEHNGRFPRHVEKLEALPGIGPYTARAVAVFAWNAPEILLETNIRRVMLHFFFRDQDRVSDSQIEPLLQRMLHHKDPRIWYWALMDYGAGPLKKISNPNRRSKHYIKQTRFEGSRRYVRSKALSFLLGCDSGKSEEHIECELLKDTHCASYLSEYDISPILEALVNEGMICRKRRLYAVARRPY
ncbi:A/G-specific adenine glycosylase [Candidatus Uhrbacteria bacterium]|nr:A/G-specific adenine glycosylase [Candidatus Uhrbacteria bacterium]